MYVFLYFFPPWLRLEDTFVFSWIHPHVSIAVISPAILTSFMGKTEIRLNLTAI